MLPPAGIDWICVSPKAGAKLVVTSGDELKLVVPQHGLDPLDLADLDFRRFSVQPDGSNTAFGSPAPTPGAGMHLSRIRRKQIAARKSAEYRRPTGQRALTLQCVKDLFDGVSHQRSLIGDMRPAHSQSMKPLRLAKRAEIGKTC